METVVRFRSMLCRHGGEVADLSLGLRCGAAAAARVSAGCHPLPPVTIPT